MKDRSIMDLHELKKRIQDHFTDGLVTIVGSGLSVAEGIPGMGKLAEHLQIEVPKSIPESGMAIWEKISESLKYGLDLESALNQNPPDTEVEKHIAVITASFLLNYEKRIFDDVLVNNKPLRFSKRLKMLRKEPNGIPIITTNYDRLIELAAEIEGLGVDSSFVGHRFGVFDSKGSRMSLCRDVKTINKRARRTYCHHIRLFKPHGSLDWYSSSNGPIRCSLELNGHRLMITPGGNKYRSGYESPFDSHISKANDIIDKASKFLILGYGFNDDHLQTHVMPRLINGDPAIIITRTLSDNAIKLISKSQGTIAITKSDNGNGSTIITHNNKVEIPELNLWDLDILIQEVWKI